MLIHELVKLSGVSARTLRYYDEIGLLVPTKEQNGYRDYTQQHIDRLQQILFYKELNFPLDKIKELLLADDYDVDKALKEQYILLKKKRDYLNDLLLTIERMEGDKKMSNEQKFEAFKNDFINDNEKQYGEELRAKYDEESIMASYGKVKEMTEEQFEAVQQLEKQLIERLQEAMVENNPTSEIAMEVVELHKRWLSFYWAKYTKEAHVGLAQMYTYDERFTTYYDSRAGQGATQFLTAAITAYAKL